MCSRSPARGGAGLQRSQPGAVPVRGERGELEAGDEVEEEVEVDEEGVSRRVEDAGQHTR